MDGATVAAAVQRFPELFGAVCLHDVCLDFSNLPDCVHEFILGDEGFFKQVKLISFR